MDAEIHIHALLPSPSISRINIMVSLQVDLSAIPSRERDGGSQKIKRYQNCLIINPQSIIYNKNRDNSSNADEVGFHDNISKFGPRNNYDNTSTYNDMDS